MKRGFSPSGSNLVPNFTWYDAKGNVIGNTKDQIVCPQKEENYKVDIIYTTCNGDTTTYSDDINLKFTVDYPTVQPYTKIFVMLQIILLWQIINSS
jgi:hypothetical protein